MILSDEQVGSAVIVIVAGDDCTRVFELNLIETHIGGNVLETIGTEIAEESHFALALFGFADSNQIDPAVVVVVEGGDAPSMDPIGNGKRDRFRVSAVVAP